MLIHNLRTLFPALLAFCIAVSSVSAGTIDYVGPTTMGGMTGWEDWANGGTTWYAGVSETNNEGPGGAAAMLFGAPSSISGNSIDFNPTFSAQAEDADSNIVDSQLNLMVVAQTGSFIESLKFTESGDTTLSGIGLGNPNNSISRITAEFFVDIVEVDGAPLVGPPINIQADIDYTPVGATAVGGEGRWSLNDDGDGLAYSTDFTGSVIIDVEQALIDAGIDFEFGATKVNVAVDNTLTAIATANGYEAFIAKKDFDGLSVTALVPEPTSVLALSGIAGFGLLRRRRA